jgi:hypothetical protein
MADPLRFHPQVFEDLKAAVTWYDGISPDLGERFRAAIEQRFDSISLMPESFGIVFADTRAARVQGFPYLLLFEHGPGVVHVLGCFIQLKIQANGEPVLPTNESLACRPPLPLL